MFNPKYRILIKSKCFPEDGVIGLGSQLISIVENIKTYMLPHVWYGADVEAVGIAARKYGLNHFQVSKIGSDLEFIEYCSEIEQFTWGVFLCVDKSFSSQEVQGIELETEDKCFRSINMDGIILEIRAFDTTYFGVYSENLGLISSISEIYKVEIESSAV